MVHSICNNLGCQSRKEVSTFQSRPMEILFPTLSSEDPTRWKFLFHLEKFSKASLKWNEISEQHRSGKKKKKLKHNFFYPDWLSVDPRIDSVWRSFRTMARKMKRERTKRVEGREKEFTSIHDGKSIRYFIRFAVNGLEGASSQVAQAAPHPQASSPSPLAASKIL